MKINLWRFLALALFCTLPAATARANVYATDVKLNGSRGVTNAVPAGGVNISYILNEPAASGVTVNILSNTTVIRTISAAAGNNGALRGLNTVHWDGLDSQSASVPLGNYFVGITPSSPGYANWTQISRDSDAGNYVYDPRGVAVDNNSNSPYYGRVFIGSAGTGPESGTRPGDMDTILKLNADGSFADDGPDGNGGFGGIFDDGQGDVPQKLRVADDDRLYMNDLTSFGEVVAFDAALTTNQVVFGQNNYFGNPYFSTLTQGGGSGWFSMDVTGAGTTNGLIWLGDIDGGGAGVWNWHLTNGVADTNDTTGNWAIVDGGSLSVAASGGLMVDSNYDIFVGQYLTDNGDTNPACMVFTNWNRAMAHNGSPVTNSTAWTVGGADATFLGVYDTTIDSRQKPKYVACALNGGPTEYGIRILSATNGVTVVPNLDGTNQYFATAWDNVGNLYGVTFTGHLLRVFSPPAGANQATTVVPFEITPGVPPAGGTIRITDNGISVTITLDAAATNSPGNFTLVSAAAISSAFQPVTNAVVTQISPGVFTFTAPVNGATQFYQVLGP